MGNIEFANYGRKREATPFPRNHLSKNDFCLKISSSAFLFSLSSSMEAAAAVSAVLANFLTTEVTASRKDLGSCITFSSPDRSFCSLKSTILHSLQVFGKILADYFLFGKKLSQLWQICDIIWLIFSVTNGQILKNNLTIWSHWLYHTLTAHHRAMTITYLDCKICCFADFFRSTVSSEMALVIFVLYSSNWLSRSPWLRVTVFYKKQLRLIHYLLM